MSIVEKAAEKLRALQPEREETPQAEEVDVATATTGPTVERLSERLRKLERPTPSEPLMHVDLDALVRVGIVPRDDGAAGRLADEVRRVKLPLLNNATAKSAKVPEFAERIMVTSAAPGEGKTFTSLNLALSLAREPDFEVLLVDADIAKSDVTRLLGLGELPGLMDVLVDTQRRATDVIVRTDIPNLLVLPAGAHSALAAELLGGQRMSYVLDELGVSDRQRLIVFDSSPLLATPEARVLAAQMGQMLIVVGAGRTRRYELKSALEGLGESQYVGLVLNKSRLPAAENPYYGYYGHHGDRGRHGPTNRDRLRDR